MGRKIFVLYQDWNDWFSNDYSRFEYWFKELDGAYSKQNDYHILALGNENLKLKPEFNVTVEIIKSTPIKQFFDLFLLKKKVNKIIQNYSPDYIYSPFPYLLNIVSRSKNYEIIGFLRALDAEMIKVKGGYRRLLGNIFYVLDYLAFKKIDILFINGKLLKVYTKQLRFKGKIVYSPRPIPDLNLFKNAKNDVILKKYCLKGKKVILTVGRLSPEKNYELAIKTLKRLPTNYVYLIVGEGEQIEYLVNLVSKLNLNDRIHFVGFVKHNHIWEYYKCADIFWLLSKTEVTPNVLKEALFAKVPIIVSNIDAMKNVIDKNCSLILNSWEEKELKEKTLKLITNRNLKTKLVTLGYDKVNNIIKKHKKLLEYFK